VYALATALTFIIFTGNLIALVNTCYLLRPEEDLNLLPPALYTGASPNVYLYVFAFLGKNRNGVALISRQSIASNTGPAKLPH
jgi:uncharacterized RDD family membrane protein YckC